MAFRKFSRLILVEQTLFALPFAYLGVLFAGGGSWQTWVWVSLALAAARTAGMAFNRVIDAEIDAQNPRTKERLLPTGGVKRRTVWIMGALASAVLIGAAYLLNDLCFYLSFVAVGLLFTYSYFKRFSASSHFYLGLIEAVAPIGGYLAVTGKFAVTPLILGLAILMWIAGLDIIYAIQDIDFDVNKGLHSIPARLGRTRALLIASICYGLSIFGLVLAGIRQHMGAPYWIATIFVGMVFLYQQWLARRYPQSGSIAGVFRVNLYVSPALLFGTALAVVLR